jgi:putative copper export protein
VLAVAVLPVPTVAGHALDPGRSWLEVPIDLLHVIAAAVWIGGLFALAFVVPRGGVSAGGGAAARASRARARIGDRGRPDGRCARSQSCPRSQLWTTGYGRAILVKTASSRCCSASARCRARESRRRVERLRSVVLAEVTILLLGVVVAVALLTSLRPGRR